MHASGPNMQLNLKQFRLEIKPVMQLNLKQNELEIKPVKLNLQQHLWLEI